MRVQKATHKGTWYPDGKELQTSLQSSFEKAKPYQSETKYVKALISPHAGYYFCLNTAACSFKSVDPSKFTRVVILGPSHKISIDCCTICETQFVEFPSGNVPVDNVCEKLCKTEFFQFLSKAKSEDEHSLEMMFPLLDFIFKGKSITVLPIMVGNLDMRKITGVVQALKPIVDDPETLLVLSSDFCHWGRTFGYTYLPQGSGEIWERIGKLDEEAMKAISTKDVQIVLNYFNKTRNTICGQIPIIIGMMLLGVNYDVQWLDYSQSNHVRKEEEMSVSYTSGVFAVNK